MEAKPYNLVGQIQYYDWGTKNEEAFIPKLLGLKIEPDKPYAEYWIGVHPKAPSEIIIGSEKHSLLKIIKSNPVEILGERVCKKFNNNLPFLLKVLSINHALSIQAHPNKDLAKMLNQKDPTNYPDQNHKPEIAIAIDHLKAIVGLKSLNEIKNVVEDNPELKILFESDLFYKEDTEKKIIKEFYSQIMSSSDFHLEKCILALAAKFDSKLELNEAENQFLIQYKEFGIDVGLISLLIFNMVNLNSDNAIFTPAGIPHAYIKGNIIECMANSDNVVRAGLTNKFKDVQTLSEMLEVDTSKSKVEIQVSDELNIFKTDAEEFEIQSLKLNSEFVEDDNSEVNIIIVLSGQISIIWNGRFMSISKGEVVLIPAILTSYKIIEEKTSRVYRVKVPK